jgi:homeobox protein cut-like
LDLDASAIASRQDTSEVSRKKLVEKSKEFKKSASEEGRREVSPLLKAFQSEVDALTKRSKAAETAFLNTYKKLIDIPDCIPVLEQAVALQQKLERAQDCEIENKQLRETLEEYNSEFAHVKNQEVTINRLKEQLKQLELRMEQSVEERVKRREAELVSEFNEKERQLEKAQEEVEARMTLADSKVSTMRQALEATQSELIELKNKFDREGAARSSEVDILMTDLDRANQRAELAERELESTRENTTLSSRHSSQLHLDVSELEAQLNSKEQEILHLFESNQKLQSELVGLRGEAVREREALKEEQGRRDAQVRAMEEKLASQKDYDDVKRELTIMKSVEFAGQVEGGQSTSKPLEVALMEKNRGLQNENTTMKMENAQLKLQLTGLKQEQAELQKTVSTQQALITKLEGDLLHVQPLLSGRDVEAPSLAPVIMADALKESTVLANQRHPSISTPPSTSGPPPYSATTGMNAESLLPIVSSQRERFKQRNVELEAECRHQKESISHLQQESDRLRADNVKLYEKIKFLQSYPASKQKTSGVEDDTVGRYSLQYEARLDPFTAFNQQVCMCVYIILNGTFNSLYPEGP